MSSPSSVAAWERATFACHRTTGAEIAQKTPLWSIGTMTAKAETARGRLTRVWPSSDQVRLVKGASITCRSGDAACSVMI